MRIDEIIESLNREIVGLSLWEAQDKLKESGYIIRVSLDNDVDLGRGYGNIHRINVEMREHRIVGIIGIG